LKALQYDYGLARWLLSNAPTQAGKRALWALSRGLGRIWPAMYWSGLGFLQYRDVEEPVLPGAEWVRVAVRYGGICGSDLGSITLHTSPSLSAWTSFPFTMGHENVGHISATGTSVEGFSVGERVVVEPLLGCEARGLLERCPACARGDAGVCENRAGGGIEAGVLTGSCASTGGSWSESFVAHQSQLLRVPEGVSDENAVLSEPFGVALHAVLRHPPPEGGTALVLGAGIIGLCVIAGLRVLGYRSRILSVARHPFQADLARSLGADLVLDPGDEPALAQALGARLAQPVLGPSLVSGGAGVVYECVGKSSSLDTAIRFTREGGTAVILGLAAMPEGIDWASVWLKEITLAGSYVYGVEDCEGRRVRTMELALELAAAGEVDLSSLVTHRFPLSEYRRALSTACAKAKHKLVKAVFAF
jgi:L-iditol 2-dehydrogenase